MVMVNNSTNTNKWNNHISPNSPNIKTKKLEMQFVARDRHKHMDELNWLMGSQLSS